MVTSRRAVASSNVAEALDRAGFGGPGSLAASSFARAAREMGPEGANSAAVDEEGSSVYVPVRAVGRVGAGAWCGAGRCRCVVWGVWVLCAVANAWSACVCAQRLLACCGRGTHWSV